MEKDVRVILCPHCNQKISVEVEALEAILVEEPPRLKKLDELVADDVPPGMDPQDVAVDYRPFRYCG